MDRTTAAAPSGDLGLHALDDLGFAAAPGIEIHRLAFGICRDFDPVRVRNDGKSKAEGKCGEEKPFHVRRLRSIWLEHT